MMFDGTYIYVGDPVRKYNAAGVLQATGTLNTGAQDYGYKSATELYALSTKQFYSDTAYISSDIIGKSFLKP
jgi:hypothetical protein